MKKIIVCLITIFAFAINVKADTYAIEGYKTIGVNTTSRLFVKDNSDHDYSNYVKWSSSNESIATVNDSGLVTGVALGKATITVEYLNDDSIEVLKGDVNADATLTATDTTLLQRYLDNQETLTDAQQIVADVNLDGVINSDDADLLASVVAKITSLSPATVDIPFNTSGIALYYDSYATDEKLGSLSYEIEVVDSVKQITMQQLITAFKSLDYYVNDLSSHNGNIVYENNKLKISYTYYDKDYETVFNVDESLLIFNNDPSSPNYVESILFEHFTDAMYLIQAALIAAGYSPDYVDIINYFNATYSVNGFQYTSYDPEDIDSLTDFVVVIDLNHLYISDDLKYSNTTTIETSTTTETKTTTKTTENKTKQAEEENPSTGVSLPVLGLGAMLLVAGGSIYYTNRKKAFNRF